MRYAIATNPCTTPPLTLHRSIRCIASKHVYRRWLSRFLPGLLFLPPPCAFLNPHHPSSVPSIITALSHQHPPPACLLQCTAYTVTEPRRSILVKAVVRKWFSSFSTVVASQAGRGLPLLLSHLSNPPALPHTPNTQHPYSAPLPQLGLFLS